MSSHIHDHRILIIDFGSQYTQLIARRIREAGVYCELRDPEITEADIKEYAPKGIILSGGPDSTIGDTAPTVPQAVFEYGVPVLGICYGMQTMAMQLGGKVESSTHREFGYAQIRARGHSKLLRDIEDHTTKEGYGLLDVWMSHGDRVTELPEGFKVIASTNSAPLAGMANEDKGFYGVQFHPEVTHTIQGQRIIERFLTEICQCDTLWTSAHIIEDSIETIRKQVGDDDVLLGLSGGVDSSVVAALLHKAIGDQLTCVFVDNGLLRQDEGDQVMAMFAKHMGIKVIRVDAEQRFLNELASENEPRQNVKLLAVFLLKSLKKNPIS